MRKSLLHNGILPVLALSLLLLLPLRAHAANWQWVRADTKLQYMDLDSTAKDKDMLRSTFKKIRGFTYYFDSDGYVHTGWLYLGKDTYFFRANGSMVQKAWIGDYYFQKDGKMAVNQWIGGKKTGKYVGSTGRWIQGYNPKIKPRFIKNAKGIRYRSSNGSYLKKTWECIKGRWYYFYSNGYLAADRAIGKYYVNKRGQMVVNRWVKTKKYRIHYGIDGRMDRKIRIKK